MAEATMTSTLARQEVVVDGNITTSYGLGGAIPFALELVRQLAGQTCRPSSDKIAGSSTPSGKRQVIKRIPYPLSQCRYAMAF